MNDAKQGGAAGGRVPLLGGRIVFHLQEGQTITESEVDSVAAPNWSFTVRVRRRDAAASSTNTPTKRDQ